MTVEGGIDHILGQLVVSGGSTAILPVGTLVRCQQCHHPHPMGESVEKSDIHIGCMDCHSMDDIKENEEEEGDPSGTVQGFTENPWTNLCDNCHRTKRWNNEGHKKHAEKRVACTICHVM